MGTFSKLQTGFDSKYLFSDRFMFRMVEDVVSANCGSLRVSSSLGDDVDENWINLHDENGRTIALINRFSNDDADHEGVTRCDFESSPEMIAFLIKWDAELVRISALIEEKKVWLQMNTWRRFFSWRTYKQWYWRVKDWFRN